MTWLIKTAILGLVVCVAVCLGLWLAQRPAATAVQPVEIADEVRHVTARSAELVKRAVDAAQGMPEMIRPLASPPEPAPADAGPSLREREARWTREWEQELVRLQELHKDLVLGEEKAQ